MPVQYSKIARAICKIIVSRMAPTLTTLRATVARWRLQRAGVRTVPFLESLMTVQRRDLEQRDRGPLLDGAHLPATLRFWRTLTQHTPQVVIDVGANVGAFTLAGRYAEGTVCHAFEPNPDLVRWLARSIETHPDHARITLHPVAVSDRPGAVTLGIDTRKSGCSSLHQSPRFRGAVQHVTVDAVRLDDVCTVPAGARLLLKTDTEGHELQVLSGAPRLLDTPDLIGITEYAPDLLAAAGTHGPDVLAILSRFHLFWLRDKPTAGLEPIADRSAAASRTGNLVYATDPAAVLAAADVAQVPIR